MTAPAHSALDAGASVTAEAFGPWNPGIESQLPRELLALSTLFRPENVRTSLADALELNDLTGLDLFDLVAFRPERLALHELLVRVTADLSVPERLARRGPRHQFPRDGQHAARESRRVADARSDRDVRPAARATCIHHRRRTRDANPEPASDPVGQDPQQGGWLRRMLRPAHRDSRRRRRADKPRPIPGDAIAAWRTRRRPRPAKTGCASPRAARWPGSSVRSWAGTATCGDRGN